MKTVNAFLLPAFALVCAVQAKIVLDSPGHVYTDQEPVTARGGVAGESCTLTDWRGRGIASVVFASDGRAAFGKMPVGYYHVRSGDADATFAVVPVPGKRAFDDSSFYGVDSAQSCVSRPGSFDCPWYGGDTFRVVSDLIQWAGLHHVRERLVAEEVSPAHGVYDYGRFMHNADLLRARGIRVSEAFHDVPDYMDRMQTLPRDLGALYTFCRDAAAAFGDRMGNWEFWNEQDIEFTPEPVWDYVAALKAAYLGFKAARPDMPVLPGAICVAERNSYDAGMFANDAAKYSDVFNFHIYSMLSEYPAVFKDLHDFMACVGLKDRAVWVTETGTNLEGHSDRDGVRADVKAHSPGQELVQAEAYVKSQVALQMQGVSRCYFFIFGAFNERGGAKDWGVLRRDGTVKPIYAAMSTLTHELGQARLMGEVKLGDGFKGYLFERPDGSQTLAFWSVSPVDTSRGTVTAEPDCAAPLALPIAPGDYTLIDFCGQRSPLTTNVVTATRHTAYLSGLRGLTADIAAIPRGKPTPYTPAADEDLSVIFRVDLNTNDFTVTGRKSIAELRADTGRLRVQAWNLSPVAKRGTVSVQGGTLTGLPAEITLPPMGKAEFDCAFTTRSNPNFVEDFILTGIFNGKRTSRLVIPVRNEKAFLACCQIVELRNWRDPKAWKRNTSADSYTVTWDESEQAIRFDLAWSKPVDRWFYPVYELKLPEESFDEAFMFEFQVKSAQDKVENDFNFRGVNVMLVYPNGIPGDVYLPYTPPMTTWETRRVQLGQGAFGKPPAGIVALRLGANPKGMKCSFWLRGPRLLKNAK